MEGAGKGRSADAESGGTSPSLNRVRLRTGVFGIGRWIVDGRRVGLGDWLNSLGLAHNWFGNRNALGLTGNGCFPQALFPVL
jgi:hypothetical protein